MGNPLINLEIVMNATNIEDAVCGDRYLHSPKRNRIFNTDRKHG